MRELNRDVKQELLAPFDAAEVRIRSKPSLQPYITARVVMSRLDDVLPFQWAFTLGDHWLDDRKVLHQKAVLTVLGASGGILNYEDVGIAPPDAGNAPAKQSKQAVSDALKRCAVHLGIGRYLYELAGVTAQAIPEATLRKALAAVSYAGPIEPRHYGKIGGIRHLDSEDEGDDDAMAEGNPAGTPPTSTWASREDRARIVLATNGKHDSPNFLDWLSKQTSNHARSLDHVLAEDVDAILSALAALAERKKS
jgi:hypothetical protein